MSENDKFRWVIGNLPTWVLLELDAMKIPHRFKYDELSDDQKFGVAMLTEIYFLVKDGEVKVLIDPETQLPEYQAKGTEEWIK